MLKKKKKQNIDIYKMFLIKHILFILLIQVLSSCNNNNLIYKEEFKDDVYSKGCYFHEKKSGLWIYSDSVNNLNYYGTYLNGKKNGTWAYLNFDGLVLYKGDYFEDNKVGTWFSFNLKGDGFQTLNYKEGELNGISSDFKFHKNNFILKRKNIVANIESGIENIYFMKCDSILYRHGSRVEHLDWIEILGVKPH